MHSQSCCERQAASSQRAAGVTGGAARLGSPVVPRASAKSQSKPEDAGQTKTAPATFCHPRRGSQYPRGAPCALPLVWTERGVCARPRGCGRQEPETRRVSFPDVEPLPRGSGDRALCRPQAASATNHSATSAPRRALPPPTAGARGDLRSAGWRGAGVSSARGVYRCVPHGPPRLLDEPRSSSAKRGEGSCHPRPGRHTPGHFRR